MNTYTTALMMTLACFTLTGCSKEPSAGDIEKALVIQAEEQAKMASKMMGVQAPKKTLQIHDLEKISCSEVQEKVYSCDIDVDATAPLVGRRQATTTIRMVNVDGDWKAAQ